MKTKGKILTVITVLFMSNLLIAQTGWNYISPKPGSKYINTENSIAFRHGDVLDLSSVRSDAIDVRSDSRGEIPGSFSLSRDMKTLMFYPDRNFDLKEKIHVSLKKGIRTVSGLEMEGLEFDFFVKEIDNTQLLIDFYEQMYKDEYSHLKSPLQNEGNRAIGSRQAQDYPSDFPVPLITEYNDPSPGYVFNTTFSFVNFVIIPGYNMILDQYGIPVYYRKFPNFAIDFRTLPGNRMAVAEGLLNPDPNNKYIIMDSHFNIIDSLFMGNGYMVDPHELLMDESGNHFLMAYDPQPVGMDTVVAGGSPTATVIGLVIQELDADNNVIFQWRSWDHYEITDCSDHIDLTADQIDYVHGNAIEIDNDGNILMSQRHMDEITKIDRNTGEIIWRFGVHAKNNMFTFTNDTIGFTHQHDIRRIANGNITLYDNGNHHVPPFSQSLEYEIDEVSLTATKVWGYINDPQVFAMATGSTRRLENDNAFIGWGFNYPVAFTEVTMAKEKTWELNFTSFAMNYRGVKEEWATDLFETSVDTIDYGEYDDYVAWPRVFVITNNADHDIQITSTHNHWDSYYVSTVLPLTVPANGTANMTVNFFPTMQGQIDDVLTLNYESMFLDSLPQCISRQIYLTGFVQDDIAPEVALSPADEATEVSQLARPEIIFNEPVEKYGGGTIKNADLKDMIIFKEGSATGEDVSYAVFMNAWKTRITITPDTLKPLTQYYVELKAGSVQDKEANVLTDAYSALWETEEEQGVAELELNNVSVYPNPTRGITYLQFAEDLPIQIDVVTITGRNILSIDDLSEKTIEIDLNNYPSGIYVVRMLFELNEEPQSLKIMKQ
ncbi:MAG: aryl-sulfate sulfotransferase [Bacteroidota bacterium]